MCHSDYPPRAWPLLRRFVTIFLALIYFYFVNNSHFTALSSAVVLKNLHFQIKEYIFRQLKWSFWKAPHLSKRNYVQTYTNTIAKLSKPYSAFIYSLRNTVNYLKFFEKMLLLMFFFIPQKVRFITRKKIPTSF